MNEQMFVFGKREHGGEWSSHSHSATLIYGSCIWPRLVSCCYERHVLYCDDEDDDNDDTLFDTIMAMMTTMRHIPSSCIHFKFNCNTKCQANHRPTIAIVGLQLNLCELCGVCVCVCACLKYVKCHC